MDRLVMSKRLGIVLVGLLVVLAGCSGTTQPTPTPTPTQQQATPVGYEFTEGESYTYAIVVRGNGSSATSIVNWAATNVSGENVSVTIRSETVRGNASMTLNGTDKTIFQTAANDPRSSFFTRLARSPMLLTPGHDLSVGNSWTVPANEITLGSGGAATTSVTVTGSRTIAGVDCKTIEMTPQGTSQSTSACVNADYPFALSLTAGNSQKTYNMTLLNATRP